MYDASTSLFMGFLGDRCPLHACWTTELPIMLHHSNTYQRLLRTFHQTTTSLKDVICTVLVSVSPVNGSTMVSTYLKSLQDSIPFPLEELYIPFATIIGFFVCMMLAGCIYTSLAPVREPSDKKKL